MSSKLVSGFALLLLAVGIATAAWWLRTAAPAWTRQQTASRLTAKLAIVPDQPAVRALRQLAEADDEWLLALVPALADRRPAVAATVAKTLDQLVERWSDAPAHESAPRIEKLARLLAEHAPRLPPERIPRAQSLAQRLLDWPLSGDLVDAAQLIAHCEVILRLTPAESDDLRMAAQEKQLPDSY